MNPIRPYLVLTACLIVLPCIAQAADPAKPTKSSKSAPAAASREKAEPALAPGALPGMSGGSFSVDMEIRSAEETFVIRRSVDGDRTRMDIRMKEMDVTQIQLGDEAGTMYTLMPKEKRAIKQSAAAMKGLAPKEEKEAKQEEGEPQGTIERVGRETVNERVADKFKVGVGEGTGLMWVDVENQLPLRMEANGTVVDFRNYQFGPQKPELFALPKGYEILDMDEMMKQAEGMGMGAGMGAMMGGMGGMGGVAGMAGGAARGAAKGMAGNMAGGLGGSLGGALGASLGGPIGSMIGQYVGQKIGSKIGSAAAGAVLPGK